MYTLRQAPEDILRLGGHLALVRELRLGNIRCWRSIDRDTRGAAAQGGPNSSYRRMNGCFNRNPHGALAVDEGIKVSARPPYARQVMSSCALRTMKAPIPKLWRSSRGRLIPVRIHHAHVSLRPCRLGDRMPWVPAARYPDIPRPYEPEPLNR